MYGTYCLFCFFILVINGLSRFTNGRLDSCHALLIWSGGFCTLNLSGGKVFFLNFHNGHATTTFPAGSYVNDIRANIRHAPIRGDFLFLRMLVRCEVAGAANLL